MNDAVVLYVFYRKDAYFINALKDYTNFTFIDIPIDYALRFQKEGLTSYFSKYADKNMYIISDDVSSGFVLSYLGEHEISCLKQAFLYFKSGFTGKLEKSAAIASHNYELYINNDYSQFKKDILYMIGKEDLKRK